ncbi:MAG: type IV pilin protein [Solirubrobacteraceae bacterium]|nr:prepilin-type N-terminal cleavage/methylation domain-containing protein [Actinomycetota bacterium]
MFTKLLRRAEGEQGFTLIELLVVILIIGILAAIAIPAFLNQKSKADASAAKTMVRTAATAMETYATDNNGSYSGATASALNSYEPSVAIAAGNGAYLSTVTATGSGYTLVAVAPGSSDTFTITNTGGGSTHTCSPSGSGGCPTGSW